MEEHAPPGLFLGLALLHGLPVVAAAEPGKLAVEPVSEHVYRWGDGVQYGAYVQTQGGMAVIDGQFCHTDLPRRPKADRCFPTIASLTGR